MNKSLLSLLTFVLTAFLSASFVSCAKDDDNYDEDGNIKPDVEVSDPEGTIQLYMMSGDIEHATKLDDNFYIGSDNNFYGRYCVSFGKVNGLGNVSYIPTTGWAENVAVIPGNGYVFCNKYDYSFYRVYVTNIITDVNGGVLGAEIKYQTPFKGKDEEILVDKDSLLFPSGGGTRKLVFKSSGVTLFNVETDIPKWCSVKKISTYSQPFLTNGIEITARGNMDDNKISGKITLTTLYGEKTVINVTIAERILEGDGTQDNPYNVASTILKASNFSPGEESSTEIYIKGIVTNIIENYNSGYGNATYYISDDKDGTNKFYIFRSKYFGNSNYSSGELLEYGDTVVVCGKITNNNGTFETVHNGSYLYSINGKTGESIDDPSIDVNQDVGDPFALNGDFECWIDGKPNNWKSTSSASNATLSQSTDAHSGKFSVKVGGTSSSNKRLAYKELSLKAGEYTMEFYVKAATADGASVRPGYAIINSDGSITGGDSYKYGDYVNDISNTTWVKVTHTFTLSSDGTYCVLIMNAKNPGKDVLIDDFKLTSGTATIIE